MLSLVIEKSGYLVRREPLKQGLGWKAASGICRANDAKIIFVDRKIPQDDQISFLLDKIRDLSLTLSEDELALLPDKLRQSFSNATV